MVGPCEKGGLVCPVYEDSCVMTHRASSVAPAARSLLGAWTRVDAEEVKPAAEAAWAARLSALWEDPQQDAVVDRAARAGGVRLLASLRAEAGHRQAQVDHVAVEMVLVGLPVSGRPEDLERLWMDVPARAALTEQATALLTEQGYQACLWIPMVCGLEAVRMARPSQLRMIIDRMAASVFGGATPPSDAEVSAWSEVLGAGRHGTQLLIGVTFGDPKAVEEQTTAIQAEGGALLPLGWVGEACYAGGPEPMEGAVQAAMIQHLLIDLCLLGQWDDADRVQDALARLDALQDGAALFEEVELDPDAEGGLVIRARVDGHGAQAHVPGPIDPDLLGTIMEDLTSVADPTPVDWSGISLEGSILEVLGRVIDRVQSPESMDAVCALLAHPPRALVPTGAARKAWVDRARVWMAACGPGPYDVDSPCTVLYRVLTAARRRDGDVWRVLVFHGEERVSFAEDNWPYFFAFALSGGFPEMAIVLRRILPRPNGPFRMMVGVLAIRDTQVELLSRKDVAHIYTTDAQTGKPIPPDPGDQYVDIAALLPGIEQMLTQTPPAVRH